MSDADQTIASGSVPPLSGAPPPRNRLLIFGGVGCLLLLCVGLVVGGGIYLSRTQIDTGLAELTATLELDTSATASTDSTPAAETPAIAPTIEATEEPEESNQPAETETPTAEPETATPTVETEFSEITFALDASPEYDPIDPGVSFEAGITEIHAIFDYSGMSPDYTWQRIWFLDGEEILSNSASWTGDEAGRFDYFIDAGGDPLSPGEWVLELYVEEELLATGSFVIKLSATDLATTQAEADTATAEAVARQTPTSAPTVAVVPTATPETGGGTYQLTFTKWDGGSHNLYVADTDGAGERYIIGRAGGPSWAPDGQNIYFYGEEGIDRQMVEGIEYVFDGISNGVVALQAVPLPNGIGQVELFQAIDWKEGTARTTTVSPNGQMVAFEARPGGGDYRIFFLGTADNQQFKFQILGEQPAWSPNSQQIVYRSGRDGITGIWISNRDDSGHTNITQGGSDSFPAWSPNGQTIAFSRDAGDNVDIYTMNTDGTNVKRLTEAPGPDTLPVYTPSGDIVFRSARSGKWAIWKMSGSGANQQEIIADAPVGPDWSSSRMSVR